MKNPLVMLESSEKFLIQNIKETIVISKIVLHMPIKNLGLNQDIQTEDVGMYEKVCFILVFYLYLGIKPFVYFYKVKTKSFLDKFVQAEYGAKVSIVNNKCKNVFLNILFLKNLYFFEKDDTTFLDIAVYNKTSFTQGSFFFVLSGVLLHGIRKIYRKVFVDLSIKKFSLCSNFFFNNISRETNIKNAIQCCPPFWVIG